MKHFHWKWFNFTYLYKSEQLTGNSLECITVNASFLMWRCCQTCFGCSMDCHSRTWLLKGTSIFITFVATFAHVSFRSVRLNESCIQKPVLYAKSRGYRLHVQIYFLTTTVWSLLFWHMWTNVSWNSSVPMNSVIFLCNTHCGLIVTICIQYVAPWIMSY